MAQHHDGILGTGAFGQADRRFGNPGDAFVVNGHRPSEQLALAAQRPRQLGRSEYEKVRNGHDDFDQESLVNLRARTPFHQHFGTPSDGDRFETGVGQRSNGCSVDYGQRRPRCDHGGERRGPAVANGGPEWLRNRVGILNQNHCRAPAGKAGLDCDGIADFDSDDHGAVVEVGCGITQHHVGRSAH